MLFLFLAALLSSSDYTGRYQQSDGNVVYVTSENGTLIVRPLFWRATQELVPDGHDRFHSRERPDRKAVFTRDEKKRVVSLTMNGIGHDAPMPRLTHHRRVPAELLMYGQPRAAAKGISPDVAIAWGEFIARALPSKWNDAATFVQAVAKKHPANAELRKVEGSLLLAAGRRAEAKKAFEAAGDAVSLRMMAPSPELHALFAKPTPEELDAVLARWAKRDLAPRDVQLVHRGTLGYAEVRILSHRVHGALHYGAVIVPNVATGFSPSRVGLKPVATRPVIVEAKGVSPSYFPLDVSRAYAPELLGNDAIYFLPSYRGEVLNFDGRTWTSEGDRTDVWDGATDDFVAFTAAALTVTPEADGERVCAFGKSRGGAVALLAGIRDRRFDCVAAWAAPTDHLFEMVQSGWTPRERAAEGLRVKADVFGIGGQFIETFLGKPRGVAEQRLHLIASSPLWFAERLPATQAHYGVDDNMVSVRNGRALASRNGKVEMVFHEEAGHDLNQAKAYRETARFLRQRLMPR